MSADSLDVDGTADQPSIIYGYTNDTDDLYSTMNDDEPQTITFSKKVDTDGRMVVPQEHCQALTTDGRKHSLSSLQKITYLDEDDGGDS